MSKINQDRDWECGAPFGRYDPRNFSFAKSFRRHGGMRHYILWLLSEKPMRGSEIIDEVQKQTMGWWRPSPGTVYPMLNNLENDGLIKRLANMQYELLEAGAEEIGLKSRKKEEDASGKWNLESVITELEGYASYLEEEQGSLKEYGDRIEGVISRLSKLKLR